MKTQKQKTIKRVNRVHNKNSGNNPSQFWKREGFSELEFTDQTTKSGLLSRILSKLGKVNS